MVELAYYPGCTEHSTGMEYSLSMRATLSALGVKPVFKRQFGGLDANWLNANGLPTVTLGAGAHNAHAVNPGKTMTATPSVALRATALTTIM